MNIQTDISVGYLPVTRANHIDDHLGSAEHRYFGSGHKQVFQRILNLAWTPAAAEAGSLRTEAQGTAEIRYPVAWSYKSNNAIGPAHVSTIDALALSLRMVEAFLSSGFGLTADQISRAWLSRYTMRPSSRPHTDMHDVPLRIVRGESRTDDRPSGRASTEFVCAVGGIKVRCHVEHDAGEAQRMGTALSLVTAPYHCGGYRRRTHEITDVTLAAAGTSVAATVWVCDTAQAGAGAGELGAAYQPALTTLDATIVYAQLGQVLMYSLDEVSRGDTNTLWMRAVDMSCSSPNSTLPGPMSCASSVTRSSVLNVAGQQWRVSAMRGSMANTTVTYSLGHRLPGEER
ncbi:AvrD family protein [Actinoplanes sp. TFC3]|uniref:AvrD family protein n=1 Tax=Actinoplanes sp. TFC3 TaxID=1710355 RepID=UPI000ABBF53D|nr:AvrD family protein [Actinoplanes sp. TFC3]